MKKFLMIISFVLIILVVVFYEFGLPPKESRLNPPQVSISAIKLVEKGVDIRTFNSSSVDFPDVAAETKEVIETCSGFQNKPSALALAFKDPLDKILEENTTSYIAANLTTPISVNGKSFRSLVYVLDSTYGKDFVFFDNGLSDIAGFYGTKKKFNRNVATHLTIEPKEVELITRTGGLNGIKWKELLPDADYNTINNIVSMVNSTDKQKFIAAEYGSGREIGHPIGLEIKLKNGSVWNIEPLYNVTIKKLSNGSESIAKPYTDRVHLSIDNNHKYEDYILPSAKIANYILRKANDDMPTINY